jgi:hypothetical protein
LPDGAGFSSGRELCEVSLPRAILHTDKGQLTCIVGIIGYFSLVDFPDKAAKSSWKFLSERECNFILRRVEKDRGDSHLEPFTYGRFLRPAMDFKIWGFALIFLLARPVKHTESPG